MLVFYCIILFVCYFSMLFHYLVSALNCLSCVVLGFQMSESSLPHIGFANGVICSTQNLASIAWAIYAPTNELISLRGVCLSRTANNIIEYSVIIKFLIDVISLDIHHLVIRLDSYLVVLQLSNVYVI
jgi:hypothetical protein